MMSREPTQKIPPQSQLAGDQAHSPCQVHAPSPQQPLRPSSSASNCRSTVNLPELVPGDGNYNATSLLNGSRAAAAFCRPFPVATVGTPASIDFDIKSSEFKLTLSTLPAPNWITPISSLKSTCFLHYGADHVAAAASGDRGNRSRKDSGASQRWARKQER